MDQSNHDFSILKRHRGNVIAPSCKRICRYGDRLFLQLRSLDIKAFCNCDRVKIPNGLNPRPATPLFCP
jgi:hypothetical protein